MSTSKLNCVSHLRPDVEDWPRHMRAKNPRPQWNGAVLKKLRESRGWDQKELAHILGCRKNQIYKWEASDSAPGGDYLVAFVVLFDAPALRFFTGIDEYQKKIAQGGGLITRVEIPLDEQTNATFFSTGGAAPDVRHSADRARDKESSAASATRPLAPKRARRAPKRRT